MKVKDLINSLQNLGPEELIGDIYTTKTTWGPYHEFQIRWPITEKEVYALRAQQRAADSSDDVAKEA
jgi:hypothetical protein